MVDSSSLYSLSYITSAYRVITAKVMKDFRLQASPGATPKIQPIDQPAHSPQLHPIERLWQFIKCQFKGESFSSLQELR
ncbi:MAG: hypothetical protein V7K25_03290 [Nostoc sp.]|uniref:hypothetical protein n=1 Tax=Nostoc sp. TaxID=1180 RepID=UPI002FFAC0A4